MGHSLPDWLKTLGSFEQNGSLELARIETILIQEDSPAKDSNGLDLKALWLESYQSRNWAKATYFLQEMTAKKVLPDHQLKLMQGLMLTRLGAQAEGFLELQSSLPSLRESAQRALAEILLTQYSKSGSLENALQVSKSLEKKSQNATLAENLEKNALRVPEKAKLSPNNKKGAAL
ncbi:MAG: hypothetical protein HYX41_01990 [Bdellovibrio sp.]|nr:hypothetical protein [Bdellovibrio sp.]